MQDIIILIYHVTYNALAGRNDMIIEKWEWGEGVRKRGRRRRRSRRKGRRSRRRGGRGEKGEDEGRWRRRGKGIEEAGGGRARG